jgi:hypothetical protein
LPRANRRFARGLQKGEPVKALVGIAVLLGVAGTVLGVVALMDEGGVSYGDEQTLELTGENEQRIDFEESNTSDPKHPLEGWATVRDISGDATGEYAVTCVPLVEDDVECAGGFQLEDGDIEVEGTEEAVDDGSATHAIVGGTGEYEGATGEFDVDWQSDTYTLRFHVVEE